MYDSLHWHLIGRIREVSDRFSLQLAQLWQAVSSGTPGRAAYFTTN